MIKNSTFIIGVIFGLISTNILLIILLFIIQSSPQNTIIEENVPPNEKSLFPPLYPENPSSIESSCSLMPCHGTDGLYCSQESFECTTEFQAGDSCRQFARCIQNENSCLLETDTKFSLCQKCVKQCEDQNKGGMDVFSCVEKCT